MMSQGIEWNAGFMLGNGFRLTCSSSSIVGDKHTSYSLTSRGPALLAPHGGGQLASDDLGSAGTIIPVLNKIKYIISTVVKGAHTHAYTLEAA